MFSKKRKTILFFVILLLLGIGVVFVMHKKESPTSQKKYFCADDKSIDVRFFQDRVVLTLAQKEKVTLYGGGNRYESAGNVFWIKDDNVLFEYGKETYFDCVPGAPKQDNIETQVDNLNETADVEIAPNL